MSMKKYHIEKTFFQAGMEIISIFFKESSAVYIPALRFRPSYHQDMAVYKKSCNILNTFNINKVKEHKVELVQDGFDDEPRDFIEGYLQVGSINTTDNLPSR